MELLLLEYFPLKVNYPSPKSAHFKSCLKLNKSNKSKDLILVLGMHRSGTSCLTGILRAYGLFAGEIPPYGSPYNFKGNQENKMVVNLNDQLLAHNNTTWFNPLVPSEIPTNIYEQANQFKQELRDSQQRLLIKDPRMLFCLDLWLDEATTFIATFRHPTSVALSLERRARERKESHLDAVNWYEVWFKYNKRLLALYEQFHFPIICFDWEEEQYLNTVSKIAKDYLGLEPPTATPFYENNLKHFRFNNSNIPDKYLELYHQLHTVAVRI